jgi:hypothetical protein
VRHQGPAAFSGVAWPGQRSNPDPRVAQRGEQERAGTPVDSRGASDGAELGVQSLGVIGSLNAPATRPVALAAEGGGAAPGARVKGGEIRSVRIGRARRRPVGMKRSRAASL